MLFRDQGVVTHILAVEDDEQVQELLSDYLSHEGFRVTLAATGATGTSPLQPTIVTLSLGTLAPAKVAILGGVQVAAVAGDALHLDAVEQRPVDVI